MTSGVICMISSETFYYGFETIHDAYYKLQRPDSDTEFEVLKRLLDCYIILLADFDKDRYDIINDFLLRNARLDEEKVNLLYSCMVEHPAETMKN